MDVHALNSNLQIIQWNARSLSNNDSDLRVLLSTQSPHIVAIQETWLKQIDNQKNNTPYFRSYEVYRKDRKDRTRRGGGILMLIRKDITYKVKELTPFNNNNSKLEIQIITIQSNSQDIDIVNIYNPPDNNLNINEFKHYFSQINNNYLIMGDFNGHHPLWEPQKNPTPNLTGRTIYNLLDENISLCLATPPNLPTHTYGFGGETSTIDLIFCPRHYLPLINTLAMADLGSDHTQF